MVHKQTTIKTPSNQNTNTKQEIIEEGRQYQIKIQNIMKIGIIVNSKSIGISLSWLFPKS